MASPTSRERGVVLPPAYLAREGMDKTCRECGETKPIRYENFAPSKRTTDGVSPTCRTCRTCQGRGAAKRNAPAKPLPSKGPLFAPDPLKDAKAYWRRVDELAGLMYETTSSGPEREAEHLEVCKTLTALVCLADDPTPGRAPNAEIAFRTFIRIAGRTIVAFKALAPVHDDIISALLSDAPNRLLLASRNSGKTTIANLFAAWRLLRNPLLVVLIVSAGERFAKRWLRAVRALIDNVPILTHLRPGDEQLDSATQFTTPQAHGRIGTSTSFTAAGLTAALAGLRAGLILLDDIEQRGDDTPEAQEKLDDRVQEFEHIRNPDSDLIVIGTPQVEGASLYGRMSTEDSYEVHRALLAVETFDEDTKRPTGIESRWVERFPPDELAKKRSRMTPREWRLHMLLELGGDHVDERPLKLKHFVTLRHDPKALTFPRLIEHGGPELTHLPRYSLDTDDGYFGPAIIHPDPVAYVATIAAVDPASGIAGRDEMGLSVVSVSASGHGIVRCCTGVRGTSPADTLDRTAALIASYRPTKVVCEARADSLYPATLTTALAKRGHPIIVDAVFSGEKKGRRILDAVGVPLAAHRLVILEAVLQADDAAETIKQIVSMTADARGLRHDDRVDSLAWAVAAIAPMLQVEPSDNVPTLANMNVEQLLRLPRRAGGIHPNGLEMQLFEMDDEHERLQMQLAQLTRIQAEDLSRGFVDTSLALRIERVRHALASQTGRPAINHPYH